MSKQNKLEPPVGARGIESRVGGGLDKGHAFDAHEQIMHIIHQHKFTTHDELEDKIIQEVIRPQGQAGKIKGYTTAEDDCILLFIYHDGTALQLAYVIENGEQAVDVRSGWDTPEKNQIN
jgi:hypothetical protein